MSENKEEKKTKGSGFLTAEDWFRGKAGITKSGRRRKPRETVQGCKLDEPVPSRKDIHIKIYG